MGRTSDENPIGVRDFDHRDIAGLAEYHEAQQAIGRLVRAVRRVQPEMLHEAWLEVVTDMAASAPYSDHCSRCRKTTGFEGSDWIIGPMAVEVDGARLTAWYLCPKCGERWTCGWSVDLPAIE